MTRRNRRQKIKRDGTVLTRLRYKEGLVEIDYIAPTTWIHGVDKPGEAKRNPNAYWRIKLRLHQLDRLPVPIRWEAEALYPTVYYAELDALALANLAVLKILDGREMGEVIIIPRPEYLAAPTAILY